jgi:hypothetical protein
LPHSAAIIFFVVLYPCDASLFPPILVKFLLSTAVMGKRSSTTAGAVSGAVAKKAKTVDADPPAVGNWVQTKIGDRELASAEKVGLRKNDLAEVLAAGPEIVPRPALGFRVLFLAFLLRGLSLPPHPFLRGLLFAYEI